MFEPQPSEKHKNLQIAWERIAALKPVVQKHRLEGDALRHLPAPIAQAFLELDMYRFQVPVALGGLGLDPFECFDLFAEVASYDGSVGWNFAICGGSVSAIATLPAEKLQKIFSTPDCGIAGSIFPPGKAVPAAGGYLFTGRWAWASGVYHAKWVNGLAIIYDDGEMRLDANGAPCFVKAQFPREAVTIHDAWHVGGMKGTGSTEYSLENYFVADTDLLSATAEPAFPDAIFWLPTTYFGMPLTAVIIGIAAGTVAAFKNLLLESKSGLQDQGYAQYAFAKSEALCAAARLYAREAFRPVWEDAQARRKTPLGVLARARGAYVLATESAVEAVRLCHAAAGGAAIFDRYPFHRNLSDIHVASSHQLLTQKMLEQVGKIGLGMQPANPALF